MMKDGRTVSETAMPLRGTIIIKSDAYVGYDLR